MFGIKGAPGLKNNSYHLRAGFIIKKVFACLIALTMISLILSGCQSPSTTEPIDNSDKTGLPDGRIKVGRLTFTEAVDPAFLPEELSSFPRNNYYLYSNECYNLFVSFSATNMVEQVVFDIDRNIATDAQLAAGRQFMKDASAALLSNVENSDLAILWLHRDIDAVLNRPVMTLDTYKRRTDSSDGDNESIRFSRGTNHEGLRFSCQIDLYTESFLFSAIGSLPGN